MRRLPWWTEILVTLCTLIVGASLVCGLQGCAAKDPNKVTPPKTIGETVCTNSSGERVACPVRKTQ